jgi:8-amino-7-oxononanoate synthase
MLAEKGESLRLALCENIRIFNDLIKKLSDKYTILASPTPIQAVIIPGNEAVVKVAELLQREGFDVRPIRFPTVAKGTERLRICLHTFNTQKEISDLINLISHSS